MIDPSTQLAALIRAQFAAQFKAQSRHRLSGQGPERQDLQAPPGGNEGTAPARSQRGISDESNADARISQMVALRVQALSPNDPQRQKKAFRIFLESVLTQEFGRDRFDDKGFEQMVDAVLQRMESDAELSAALHEAGNLLLAEAGAPRPHTEAHKPSR